VPPVFPTRIVGETFTASAAELVAPDPALEESGRRAKAGKPQQPDEDENRAGHLTDHSEHGHGDDHVVRHVAGNCSRV
jgi:hypothetical protein